MKKNRNTIIIIIVVALAFGAGLLWRWVQGTPYYALYQIGAGLKNRDLPTFLTYVNLESILNQQISESVSKLLSQAASETVDRITGPLGEIKIKITPEGDKSLSNLAIGQLQNYLQNKENPTLPSSFTLLALAGINVKKDYALVTLKKDKELLRMGMKKQEGLWRVVELNPEDTQKLIKTYLLPPKK
ncbi:MAG: hypothetical protein HY787_08050 [Deltaproteobacteria bacterium]|nr:hypothetical protein [Deltaproteobacteria bacterium]